MAEKIPDSKRKEIARIIRKNKNVKYLDVAAEFGVSRQTVSNIAREIGTPSRRRRFPSKEARDKTRQLIIDNPHLSYPKIAKIAGVSDSSVSHLAQVSGISRKVNHDERRRIIMDFYEKHPDMPFVRISDALHVPAGYISNVIHKELKTEKIKPRIDLGKLEKLLKEKPFLSRRSLAEMFGVTVHAISAAKQRLAKPKITHKQRPTRIDWEKLWPIIEENKGLSTPKIAKILGISVASLHQEFRRRGYQHGHTRKLDYDELTEVFNEGGLPLAIERLCPKYDVKPVSVVAAARTLGLYAPKRKRKYYSRPEPEEIISFYEKHKPVSRKAIANHFGTTIGYVSRVLIPLVGLQYHERKPFDKAEAERLLRESPKISYAAIARSVGGTQYLIAKLAKSLGIFHERGKKKKQRVARGRK